MSEDNIRMMKEFTIYHNRVTKTRWPGPIVEGVRRYYTGLVHHIIQNEDGNIYIGSTLCSKDDQYNKKVARGIARGRAIMCKKLVEKGAPMHRIRVNTNSDTIEGYGYDHVAGFRSKYGITKNGRRLPRNVEMTT